jgi:hypothetical protein
MWLVCVEDEHLDDDLQQRSDAGSRGGGHPALYEKSNALMLHWIPPGALTCQVLEYHQAENRALREQFGNKRLRFTDEQRRRLAVKGHALGRKALRELGCIVTPDTILRWYRELIAEKYDGSEQRKMGRPRTPDELRDLVTRMA